jgi:hypothetical protein
MAEEGEKKPPRWRCRHLYPVLVVTGPGGERRARCLGCAMLGPWAMDLAGAMRALRECLENDEGSRLSTTDNASANMPVPLKRLDGIAPNDRP